MTQVQHVVTIFLIASEVTFSISNVTQCVENMRTVPLSPQVCALIHSCTQMSMIHKYPQRQIYYWPSNQEETAALLQLFPLKVIGGSGSSPASIHLHNLWSMHGVGYRVHVLQAARTVSLWWGFLHRRQNTKSLLPCYSIWSDGQLRRILTVSNLFIFTNNEATIAPGNIQSFTNKMKLSWFVGAKICRRFIGDDGLCVSVGSYLHSCRPF